MKLGTKILLAQLPLVVALGVTIGVGSVVTRALARGSEHILKDNYGSVLAAEHMKEAAERVNDGVLFAIIGRAGRGLTEIDANLPRFEDKLRTQEGNLTEPSEPVNDMHQVEVPPLALEDAVRLATDLVQGDANGAGDFGASGPRSSYTMGGFIHVLVAVAAVAVTFPGGESESA